MSHRLHSSFRARAAALARSVLAALLLSALATLLLMPAVADAKRRIAVPASVQPGVAFSVTTTGWQRGARVHLYVFEWQTENVRSVGRRTVKRGRAKFRVKLTPQLDLTRDWVVTACDRKGCKGGRRVTRRLKVVARTGGPETPKSSPAPSPGKGRGGIVDADKGTVGSLTIDQSTPAEVAAAVGDPERTGERSERGGGSVYRYACEAGPVCATEYTFSNATGKLVDFTTTEPSYRTPAGTAPGMAASRAAELEGLPFETTCVDGIFRLGASSWSFVTKQEETVHAIWLGSITNSLADC